MSSVVTASLAAVLAALLAAPQRPRPPRGPASQRRPPDDRAFLLRARPVLAALAFLGAWIFVGGPIGAVAGLTAAVATWRVLGRAEGPAARRRREELERDLPTAVHLLGACLAAGSAVSGALGVVADALPGAVAEELRVVDRRLALGGDPVEVWRALAGHPQLGALGRTLARAHQSGSSVCTAVEALAAELSARSKARTDALARSVEVRAAAPLGACFLPGFVLLGVVPMVVGVFSVMRPFG
jgi:Flp pilus assembly protein TadB